MASLSMDSVTGAHARRWSLSALLRWLQAPIAPQSTALEAVLEHSQQRWEPARSIWTWR